MTLGEPDPFSDEVANPPDAPAQTVTPTGGRGRRQFVGLAPAGVILPLAVVGLIIWLLASGCFGRTSSTSQTPQGLPEVMATPTAPAAPKTAGTAAPDESPSREEFVQRLAEAGALTQESNFDEAITLYQELVQQAPEDAQAEVGWAWALIFDGQAEEALAHAHRAVELDPVSAETMTVLARAYLETGDRSRALGMAQNAVEIDPDNAEAHAVLAEAYLLSGQEQEAVDESDLAVAQDAASAEAHRIRGWLYDRVDGDLEAAARELQLAAGLQPALWLRHHDLGLIWLKAQDYGRAIAALSEALGLRPQAATYSALGEAYYYVGDYERARSFLDRALAAGARDANTYALLAMVEVQEGHCDAAEFHYEQALAQDSGHRLALQARDTCLGIETPATPAAPTSEAPPSVAPQPIAPLAGRIAFPVWDADGSKYDTYVANADGSSRQLVAEQVHQPAFSPDGQWLAANGERPQRMTLLLVRPDGSDLREITEYIEDGLPCWSPDGRGLVFSSTRHSDRRSRLYIIDQVPLEGERPQGRLLTSDLYELLGESPAWTAGGEIVYNGCDYTITPAQCGLFLLPSEPGPQEPQPLTSHAEDMAPAAFGSQIAFMSNRDGNWEIYLVNSDGSGLRRLTRNSANDGLPAWSPDGKTLAFVSDEGGTWAVWAIDPDGSNRRKLFDLGGAGLAADWHNERISWGP